ncbi:MAG: hypothetical protein V4539_04305 [Bacteroidota bacterium]
MRSLTTLMLLTIYLTTTGQPSPAKKESWFRADTSYAYNSKRQKKLTHYSYESIDTEVKYSGSKGKGIIIQNSLPRGNRYIDPAGRISAYGIFWTRVINETTTPFELTINFPADSFAIPADPGHYLRVFLPPGSMTLEESSYNYGVTDLESFLDTGLNKPTTLKRIINPKEECLFYTGALPGAGYRAGFVLKGQDLFYRINIIPDLLIPCGQIAF